MVPIPINEDFRLEVIRTLDLPAENQSPALGDLARLAAQIFDVPMALVSVVNENRQKALASVGMEAIDIPRSASICAHTVARDRVLVISDTALDDRFHQSCLVTGPPYARFYAGAPLVLPEGFVIGTFCVMDRRPRPGFGAAAREQLADLAGAAVREIVGTSGSPAGAEGGLADPVLPPAPASAITQDARFSAFAELAHDICSGLDEIKQASDALGEVSLTGDRDSLRPLIEQIQASTSYVHKITGRTLDLARLRAGAVSLNETIVDVTDVLQKVLDRSQGLARKHGVKLGYSPMELRPRILADALLLEQMITNLMTNAIVHSLPGSQVNWAMTAAVGGELVMAAKNHGPALSEDDILQAFKPFYVFGRNAGARRSAGLGLPITRKLVELHGGAIDISSSPDMGTEVRLTFPAYRVLTWYADREIASPD